MFGKRKLTIIWMTISLALFAAGCKKKVPPPAPPPPPPPSTSTETTKTVVSAPVIAQFTAEPSSIQRGQTSTLRWEVTGDVSSVSINQGVGTVQKTGSQRVSPSDSVTYTLTANGPGGPTTLSTTVNVSSPGPPPPPPPTTTGGGTVGSRLDSDVQDVYFDYDKSDVRGDARDTLSKDAAALKGILADFPNSTIVIEGHCDERGSAEYNLGLGDRRANSARDFLQQLGVPSDRMKIISYGKERPQCNEQNESCWQRNRRAHFAPGQ